MKRPAFLTAAAAALLAAATASAQTPTVEARIVPDRIGIGDSLQQLRLVSILLQQRERMTRALYDFANTVDSLLCEGLLGSYQNFHLFQ